MIKTERKKRAVLLDKDGTILKNIPYNVDSTKMEFAAGAKEGLALLHSLQYCIIVASNQPGVALGYYPEAALAEVARQLRAMLAGIGVPLHGFYYCPHHPEGVVRQYAIQCACRKPAPGMLLQAAQDHQLDLTRSWFVGDILNDIQAGRNAGCQTILLDNGGETEWQLSPLRTPHYQVENLEQAAWKILEVELAREGLALEPARTRQT